MDKFSSANGQIAYTMQAKGDRHFLLVHNSGGSHAMMAATAAHFSKLGTVLSPDLLGHGASDAPAIAYTPEVFAEGLIQLCAHLNLQKLVLIGLNYGGNVGLAMTQMAPKLFSHLILIEPPIFMEPWIREVVEQQIEDLERADLDKEKWAEELCRAVFVRALPHERAIALKALMRVPAFVKASTFRELLRWKMPSQCAVPSLLIQTTQPFCTEEKARTLFANLQVGRVVGSGPWATLEVPNQTHAMIDRFLELSN
jgi:pimeloyl-ACP methyl ester carboxylesterase